MDTTESSDNTFYTIESDLEDLSVPLDTSNKKLF